MNVAAALNPRSKPVSIGTRRVVAFLFIFAIAGIATLFAYVGYRWPTTGIDDADILFVYAKNLADGNGFVYNVGGERVEGFTSMLWTLVLAALFWVTPRPELPAALFNLLVVSATLTWMILFVERHLAPLLRRSGHKAPVLSYASLVLAAWVFASPNFISWTVLSLMETGLWSALFVSITVLLLYLCLRDAPSYRQGLWVALLVGGLVLTRPETMLWGPLFCGLYFLTVLRQSGRLVTALQHALLPLFGFAVTLVALTAFRLSYFGYPLPNTYYAKVSPDRLYNLIGGTKYALNFVSSNGFIQLCLLAALAGVGVFAVQLWKRRGTILTRGSGFNLAYAQIGIIVLVGMVVPVLNGGDHFGQHRFYQPLWPLLPLPVYFGLMYLARRLDLNVLGRSLYPHRYVLLFPIFLLFSWSNRHTWHELEKAELRDQFVIASTGRATGAFLNQFFEPLPLPNVGVIPAGGVKHTYQGHINDLLGLNNVVMAHNDGARKGPLGHAAFEQDVFYMQRPELLLPRPITDTRSVVVEPHPFNNSVLKGMLTSSRFLEAYRFAVLQRRVDYTDTSLAAYFRSDFLDLLLQSDQYVFDARVKVALLEAEETSGRSIKQP